MRKLLPLAGIGCIAVIVLSLIVGGAIMLVYGINGYIKKKEANKKVWIAPENPHAHLRMGENA